MRLRARFPQAVAEVEASQEEPATPSQLSAVAAKLLRAGGAGLVMSCRLVRLPVGASDENARIAEEIQASLGEGPCLTAEATRSVMVADHDELTELWPVYYAELARRTPFRATVSFPVLHSPAGFAALNLYYPDTTATLVESLDAVQDEVVDQIGIRLLRDQFSRLDDDRLSDGHHRRQKVWTAVGILQAASGTTDTDALALLRGHAFRTDRLVGDVAADLVRHELPVRAVLDML